MKILERITSDMANETMLTHSSWFHVFSRERHDISHSLKWRKLRMYEYHNTCSNITNSMQQLELCRWRFFFSLCRCISILFVEEHTQQTHKPSTSLQLQLKSESSSHKLCMYFQVLTQSSNPRKKSTRLWFVPWPFSMWLIDGDT